MLFSPLSPKGDDAIRAVYDTGLLEPLGHNVDSSRKFKVPLLYRIGLGMSDRNHTHRPHQKKPGEQRHHGHPTGEHVVAGDHKMN